MSSGMSADAIAGMALGTADIIGNTLTNYYTNKANINLQKDLANLEWSRNLQMWNMQNEYNHPINQMQRFAQAGLNPNLIYGKGTAGNAEQLPKYQRPEAQIQPRESMNMLGKYMNIRQLQLQKDAVKARVNNIEADTINKQAETLGKVSESLRKKIEANIAEKTENITIDSEQQKLQNLRQSFKNLEAFNEKYKADTKLVNANKLLIDRKISYQDWVNKLTESGVTAQDRWWIRQTMRFLTGEMDVNTPENTGTTWRP